MWLALPALTLGARSELRGAPPGVAIPRPPAPLDGAPDPQAVLDRPDDPTFLIALAIATSPFSGGT